MCVCVKELECNTSELTWCKRRLQRVNTSCMEGPAVLKEAVSPALNTPAQVAWLNISVSGLERLMLEAVLFGRVLNDVERTFDIEYGLV